MYTDEHEDFYNPRKKGRKKKKSKKGLHGTQQSGGKSSGTGKELSKPLFVVGGLLIGNLVGKGIDKFIPVPSDTPGFKIKSIVKPILQAGLGVGVILLSRERSQDKQGVKTIKELARSFGYGVAGSGVVSTVKLINKDIFAGLGETGDTPIEAKYYREAKDEIMQMLQDNSFRPALPEAPSMMQERISQSEMNGLNYAEDAEIL